MGVIALGGGGGSTLSLGGLGSLILTSTAIGSLPWIIDQVTDNISGGNNDCECKGKEIVYRVFGQQAKLYGRYWTPVNPSSIPNYRDSAGLPNNNRGKYLAKGCLIDDTGVVRGSAAPLDGNQGGHPEYVVPNPQSQIEIIDVKLMNTLF